MGASPRIITVDPTGTIARIVRSAMDLVGRQVILVDMASGREALEEIKSRPCQLVVTNVELDHDIKGYQLAIEVRQAKPNTNVIILADVDDPELDPEDIAGSPFVYLHRPVDIHQFLRVLIAGLDGDDIFAALNPQAGGGAPFVRDMGEVPHLDVEAARMSIDKLLTDVGAMAIVLASRTGEVLLERGAVGYLDRERLTGALLPMVTTSIDMSELVGGRSSTLQFYDGEEYDVFVLSVGVHHFLCLVFDGSAGNRQFGAVNRFGRRAAEDLIVLLGTSAFTFQKPKPPQVEVQKKGKQAAEPAQEVFEPIARAEVKVQEPEPLRLDPISDLDFSIFDQLPNVNIAAADDLFSLDNLAELASETLRTGGPIDFDKAQQMGIMPDLDSK
jgi:ActR/RegA family two-component response regulator